MAINSAWVKIIIVTANLLLSVNEHKSYILVGI